MVPSAAEIFDHLVAEHQASIARLCRAILRDDHPGADAAQETFLRLWRRFDERRVPEFCEAWLRKVAVSTSLDLGRKRSAQAEASAKLGRQLDEAAAASTDESASVAELERCFDRTLLRFPEGQRTVFLLRYEGGLSLKQVAETLEIGLPTVRTQFARACLKLQDHLRPFLRDLHPSP